MSSQDNALINYAAKLSTDPALSSVESPRILEAVQRIGWPERPPPAGNTVWLPEFTPGTRCADDRLDNLEHVVRYSRGAGIFAVALTDSKKWAENIATALDLYAQHIRHGIHSFQERVKPWLHECFGEMIAGDKEERNHRFLEEALELVQACGCTKEEALKLVDYVYGRPVGEKGQEVGGTMVTLAALCIAQGINLNEEAERELSRINLPEVVLKIRAKQAAKPKFSPLPGIVFKKQTKRQLRKAGFNL